MANTPARTKVTFGGVTVSVARPNATEVKRNAAVSADALDRARSRLARPGIRLYAKKDVPLYSADPDRPDVFVRKLNGKIDRGVLENGEFKVIG